LIEENGKRKKINSDYKNIFAHNKKYSAENISSHLVLVPTDVTISWQCCFRKHKMLARSQFPQPNLANIRGK
jgi:hypothetical protein